MDVPERPDCTADPQFFSGTGMGQDAPAGVPSVSVCDESLGTTLHIIFVYIKREYIQIFMYVRKHPVRQFSIFCFFEIWKTGFHMEIMTPHF